MLLFVGRWVGYSSLVFMHIFNFCSGKSENFNQELVLYLAEIEKLGLLIPFLLLVHGLIGYWLNKQ